MSRAIHYLEKLVQFRQEIIADNLPARGVADEGRAQAAGAGASGMELVS